MCVETIAGLDDIRPEALTGGFSGLYKLRIGGCRVVHELLHSEQETEIHMIDHRREIYHKP